jgi:hypothetical protein
MSLLHDVVGVATLKHQQRQFLYLKNDTPKEQRS